LLFWFILQILFKKKFQEQDLECTLSKCPNNQCHCRPDDYFPQIANQLVLAIRKNIRKYYEVSQGC